MNEQVKDIIEEQGARVGEAARMAGSAIGDALKEFGSSLGAALTGLAEVFDDATQQVKAAKTTATEAEGAAAGEPGPTA